MMLLAGSISTGAVVTGCSAEAGETEESGASSDAVVIETKGAIGALNASLEGAVGTEFPSSYPGVESWTYYQTQQGVAIRGKGEDHDSVVVFVGVPNPAVSGRASNALRSVVQSDLAFPGGEDGRIRDAIGADYQSHLAPAQGGGIKAKNFSPGCIGLVMGHIGVAFVSGGMGISGIAGITQGGGKRAVAVTAASAAIHAANFASYLQGSCI